MLFRPGLPGSRFGCRQGKLANTPPFAVSSPGTAASQIELGHRLGKTHGLLAHGFGSRSSLLDQRGVLLRHFIHLADRDIDLLDTGRLLAGGRRNLTDNPADPLDVLAKLGGFDIAGLCGVFLGGALEGVPILMDGFISSVAALCAVRLCPAAAKAVFASHVSAEPAAHMVLDALGKAPLITANLHLGEGTGAVASIPLWDMALAVYRGCYSFAEGGIAPYTPQC